MSQSGPAVTTAPYAMGRQILKGVKWLTHQHPALLGAARWMRALLVSKPKPPKLLPGFAPLHIDENKLRELAQISPKIVDMLLSEFAEMSRDINGADTGFSVGARAVLQNPLDGLITWALNLNFVYTPGHVGSCTAAATLERHPSIMSPIPVVHHISKQSLAYLKQVGQQSLRWPASVGNWRETVFWTRMFRLRILLNLALRAHGALPGVHKPLVISGVREPIGGHLSRCFYAWWAHAHTPAGITVELVQNVMATQPWYLWCNDWLDHDLKGVLSIDVYARPFPAERGWEIYENDSARVLLIRQENLASLSEALGALYGLDAQTLPIVSSNRAETKDYAVYHDAVKKTLRLTKSALDEVFRLPYVQHFYTPGEVAAFKKRWQIEGIDRKAA